MSVLSSERLLEEATELTGLSDFGDLPFLDGLEAQLWSLEHESGHPTERLDALTRPHLQLLVKRLKLVADRRAYPEIATQEVRAPLVVLGLPRTGSTHLHALLATRPRARAPLQWEMSEPSPPPDVTTAATDPRIAAVQAALDARPHAAELQAVHPFGAERPEQCIGLLDWSFANQAALASQRLPSYFEWYLAADLRVAYEHHRRTLQHLQWRHPGEWALKWPKHVFACDALLATYPDARIVWTHRDPARVLPSAVSFVGAIRSLSSPLFEPRRFAAEWVAVEELGLRRAMDVRDRIDDERRFCDVHYNDLLADPVGTVERIYAHFDIPVDDEVRRRVDRFQDANPKDKHGPHRYVPVEFGLDEADLRRRFGDYIERYGVESDAR